MFYMGCLIYAELPAICFVTCALIFKTYDLSLAVIPYSCMNFQCLFGNCQLKISTCHLPLQGVSHQPLQPLIFNTHQKEMRHSVLWEKLAGWAFRQLDTLRRRFFKPQFLHYLRGRKALQSLMVTSTPHDWKQAFPKMCA